jgi:hypothetical protein
VPQPTIWDNIIIDLKTAGYGGRALNMIAVAQDRDKSRAVVNTVTNLQVL